MGLDIQDDLGRHEVGFVENVDKQPIEDGAGCRFSANFKVNKVRHHSITTTLFSYIFSMLGEINHSVLL